MQAGDWNITEIERNPHSDSRLESLSFTIHFGHTTERLKDVPLPKGMQPFDLACWCAEGLRQNAPEIHRGEQFIASPTRALKIAMENHIPEQGSERTFG